MRTVFVLVLAAVAVSAQDIAPDVMLLGHVLQRSRDELRRLQDVSCLETVDRQHQPKNGKMKPLDTVRLEVLTNGTKELYASPGARSFSENPPIDWVGSGTLGNGFFGLYLAKILGGHATFLWKGYEKIAGRRLGRWDYQLPVQWAGQSFVILGGSGSVSLHGSFWADPQSYDMVRLNVAAGDIPNTLPLTSAEWSIDYAPTAVNGNLTVLLPQTADFAMVKQSGEASDDRFAFTQCHTFEAETKLIFNGPDNPEGPPQFGASAVDDTLRALPVGLEIPVQLTSGIADGKFVGGLIDGVVSRDVLLKGQVAIPSGSPVRGRIRRLEQYSDPVPYFVVAIEYTEVAIQGIRYRFDADLTRIEPAEHVSDSLPAGTGGLDRVAMTGRVGNGAIPFETREKLRVTKLPGVATFLFVGTQLDLREGFETIWNTKRKGKK